MKAISIKQPWAALIVEGHKDIENRDWATSFRGPVLIHAGKNWDDWAVTKRNGEDCWTPDFTKWLKIRNLYQALDRVNSLDKLQRGGIIGIANITGCVSESNSPWFCGLYGFTLSNGRILPFVPLRGQLGFFDVPDEVVKQLGVEGQVSE